MMARKPLLIVAASLVALSAPAVGQTSRAGSALVGAEEAAELRRVANRGQQLFEIDRAARLTTRDLFVRIPDPDAAGIVGWIAEPQGNGLTVLYYTEGPSGPVVVYRGQVIDNRVAARDVFQGADRPALTPSQQRLARARAAATALDHQSCGGAPFNILVVPPEPAGGPIDVYEFSAQTERGRLPLGGHYRTTIAADGSVASSAPLAGACTFLDVPESSEGAPRRPLAIEAAGALPSELHVLLSYWAGRPLLVAAGTPQRVWGIAGSEIALAARRETTPPPGEGR